MSYSGSRDDQGNNQSNITDQEGPTIHGPFPYISLMFKLTSTLIIILMASLVCVTIKKTKRLHRPHNILVANVMIADIMLALWDTIPTSIAIIAYAAGKNVIHCGILNFVYHPVIVYHTTFVMISIDKVISIAYPLKHKNIMKRAVYKMITLSWLLAIAAPFYTLFITKGGTEVAEYGVCIFTGTEFIIILPYAIAILLEALITTMLNIYMAIRAYQFHREIQKRTRLAAVTNQVEDLKHKLRTIKKQMKPIQTLFVIFIAHSFLSIIFIGTHIPRRSLRNSVYYEIVDDLITPNIVFISTLFHPIVYGIYFKEIRQPLMKIILNCYNRCKQNTAVVTP